MQQATNGVLDVIADDFPEARLHGEWFTREGQINDYLAEIVITVIPGA